VTLGISTSATNEYDPDFEEYVKTPLQGKVIMVLDNLYQTEINRNKFTWNLEVGVPSGSTTLKWNPSDIPQKITLRLNDKDMRTFDRLELKQGSYNFLITATYGGDKK
ncbi:MAG: hypothetical protein ACE5J9_11685, partial [Methanosarcinales archaeon]